MILAAFLLALATVAAVVFVLERRRNLAGLLRSHHRHRAIVTLKSGEAFAGVLFASDRDALSLREAEALGQGERRSNLMVDGEVLILRADIAYLQLP